MKGEKSDFSAPTNGATLNYFFDDFSLFFRVFYATLVVLVGDPQKTFHLVSFYDFCVTNFD